MAGYSWGRWLSSNSKCSEERLVGGDQVPAANMWLDFALVLLRKRVSWVWVVTAGDKAAP